MLRRLIRNAAAILQQLHVRMAANAHPGRNSLWPLAAPLGIILGSLKSAHAEDAEAVKQTRDSFASYTNSIQQPGVVPESLHLADPEKVISNEHTARWRVYTDLGRDLFSKGRLAESEFYFLQALEEAKKGFGESDPHVASSCNNLAELFRMKKEFDKAETLYLEAIRRLEQAMGAEHESVGFALHNLAGMYLLHKQLEKARECYERALKINERRLGRNHPEYANTMFHLAEVLRIMGGSADAEALVRDSIRVLEEAGAGNNKVTLRRMGRLAEILIESNKLQEAENLQRKIVQILDMTEGPEASSTVQALEHLASTLQTRHKLDESEELFQRCFETKQKVFPACSIQLWGPLFKLASIALERGDVLASQNDSLNALVEYEKAEELLQQALSIADKNWKESCSSSATGVELKRGFESVQLFQIRIFLALIQSLNTIGTIGARKSELPGCEGEANDARAKAEAALSRCQSLVRKPENAELSALPRIKKEYAKCLQQLAKLLDTNKHVPDRTGLKKSERQWLSQEASLEAEHVD